MTATFRPSRVSFALSQIRCSSLNSTLLSTRTVSFGMNLLFDPEITLLPEYQKSGVPER